MYEIIMESEAYERFQMYTKLCPDEVAAFGYCRPVESRPDSEVPGFIHVSEIFLVEQEVTGGSVDFMSDGLPEAIKRATQDGKLDQLRFCVHSHVDMRADWSDIDEEMIRKVGSTGTPWFASAIFNKRGSTAGRVDVFRQDVGLPGVEPQQVTIDAKIMSLDQEALRDECLDDLSAKVTKRKIQAATQKGNRQAGDMTTPRALPPAKDASLKHLPDDEIMEFEDGEQYVLDAMGRFVSVENLTDHDWDYLDALYNRGWDGHLDR